MPTPRNKNPHKQAVGLSLLLLGFTILLAFTISRLESDTLTPPILSFPTPKPLQIIDQYQPPSITPNSAYTIIFLGDSMTESLGVNFDALRINLKNYYPNTIFGLFNYGYGSTNILTADDRLHHQTTYRNITLPAILDRSFDIIVIESFGNNPLSQFPLEVGLEKQAEALDHLVAEIVSAKPDSLIIFMATIAPSQTLYGKNAVDLSTKQRIIWADERRAYIENHITYAQNHNIPLIDVYTASQDLNKLANDRYLNPSDHIHPSVEGIILISQTIANYFTKNHIIK